MYHPLQNLKNISFGYMIIKNEIFYDHKEV